MFSPIKIEQLLQQAERTEEILHDAEEATKVGVLRGGNSGVLTADGEIYGKCPRRSLLRYLGIDAPTDLRSRFFFAAGYANEERWTELLEKVRPGRLLREEQVPIRWTITHPGTGKEIEVTGRPDLVLTDESGVPVVGLELKKVCSSYRATRAFIEYDPDPEHMAQAAHYSLKLGKLPWILSYTSDSSYDTPYWAIKKYNADRKIQPGRTHFYCGWQDDTWCFIHPDTGELVETKITGAGIERYYQYILALETEKTLGPRPDKTPFYPGGRDPDPCRYCVFRSACDTYETRTYDEWIDAARIASNEGGEE